MTIRSLTAFTDAVWDWSMLDGCFGNSHIRPSDVDGEVECNGQFLVLEGKGLNGTISDGQARTIEAKRRQGNFTTIVFWGQPRCLQVERMRVVTFWDAGKVVEATSEDLRRVVADWYRFATEGWGTLDEAR